MQARLTEDAAAGWDRACTRRNITWTALIEALGERLAVGDDGWLPDDVVDRARQVDRARRSRR